MKAILDTKHVACLQANKLFLVTNLSSRTDVIWLTQCLHHVYIPFGHFHPFWQITDLATWTRLTSTSFQGNMDHLERGRGVCSKDNVFSNCLVSSTSLFTVVNEFTTCHNLYYVAFRLINNVNHYQNLNERERQV